MAKFQNELKRIRSERGLTQAEVAQSVGISVLSYQRYEYGERDIPGAVLISLARKFEVTTDAILAPSLYLGAVEDKTSDEQELLGCYRASTPQWKNNILMTARAAAGQSREDAEGAAPAEKVS